MPRRKRVIQSVKRGVEYPADNEARSGKTPKKWDPDDPTLLPFFAIGPELYACERGRVPERMSP